MIDDLIRMQKVVTNPNARFSEQAGHNKKNYDLTGELGYSFSVYVRQNLRPGMEDDFSCGLLYFLPSGEKITLIRYNGSSHPHTNKLDKSKTDFICHIHKAREEYIIAGLDPEGHATATTRYNTLNGALDCLIQDCNIANLKSNSDGFQLPIPY